MLLRPVDRTYNHQDTSQGSIGAGPPLRVVNNGMIPNNSLDDHDEATIHKVGFRPSVVRCT